MYHKMSSKYKRDYLRGQKALQLDWHFFPLEISHCLLGNSLQSNIHCLTDIDTK